METGDKVRQDVVINGVLVKGELHLCRVLDVSAVRTGCEPHPLVIGDVHGFPSTGVVVIAAAAQRRGWSPESSQGTAARQSRRRSMGNPRQRCGRAAPRCGHSWRGGLGRVPEEEWQAAACDRVLRRPMLRYAALR